jgi:hypothetical protein
MQLHETRFRGIEDQIRRPVKKRVSGEASQLINFQVRLAERIARVLVGKNQTLSQSILALSRGAATRMTAAKSQKGHRTPRATTKANIPAC